MVQYFDIKAINIFFLVQKDDTQQKWVSSREKKNLGDEASILVVVSFF